MRRFNPALHGYHLANSDEDPKKSVEIQDPYWMKYIWFILFIWRLVNSFTVVTFDVPDEYWQSYEVAHRFVFGYGRLTWEWKQGLRSYTFPFFFAVIYKLLQVLECDETVLMWVLPRLFLAAVAATGDWASVKLALRVSQPSPYLKSHLVYWAVIWTATSWFNWYQTTRALANAMERTWTALAMMHWPWFMEQRREKSVWYRMMLSLLFIGISCIIRPTAAIPWLLPSAILFIQWPQSRMRLVLLVCLMASLCIASMLCIDRVGYGHWIITPLAFYQFNVSQGLATFYGWNAWHWYWSQGWPVVGNIAWIPTVIALVHQSHLRSPFMSTVIVSTVLLGLASAHKEFRFLLPLLPMLLAYAAIGTLQVMHTKSHQVIRLWTLILFLLNAIPAIYLTQVHQSGVISVMHYLREEAKLKGDEMSVAFLMPCHSTPFYSSLHVPIPLRQLSCDPPLNGTLLSHQTEQDIFYENPALFLRSALVFRSKDTVTPEEVEDGVVPTHSSFRRWPRGVWRWPSHLVFFEVLLPRLEPLFQLFPFKECSRHFNSHWHDDERRRGDVLVYCSGNDETTG